MTSFKGQIVQNAEYAYNSYKERCKLADDVKRVEDVLDTLKYHYDNRILINNKDAVEQMWQICFKTLKNVREDLE